MLHILRIISYSFTMPLNFHEMSALKLFMVANLRYQLSW